MSIATDQEAARTVSSRKESFTPVSRPTSAAHPRTPQTNTHTLTRMKPNARLTLLASLLALPFSGYPAQPVGAPVLQQSGADLSQPQNYAVAQRGPHHRVMATVVWTTNAMGRIIARTNSYTELAIGMNVIKDGQWVESSTEIEIVPGGAIARKGPHTVSFAADLSTPGAIDCTTPDGKRLRSSIVGLGYWDAATGKSVLIAELKSSTGELLPSGNSVRYPDAFTIPADVIYSYTRAGLIQDIILRAQPPSPSEFGLDPRTTRLEVITEFHDPPAPTTTSVAIEPQRRAPGRATDVSNAALPDQTVSFGAMQLQRGQAFMVGSESNSTAHVAVGKSWLNESGRSFLVEEVNYEAIQPQIQTLPVPTSPPQAGGTREGALLRVSPRRLLPAPRMARHSTNVMLLANSASLGKGFVLDYNLSGSLSNFTFQGDTTYYVAGEVLLSGLTQIEGGSVIKFPTNGFSLTIAGGGAIQCLTSPYRPAIFTAKDDNTVGETIAGSTGVPTNYYGGIALDLSAVSFPAISNAHFSFLNNALAGTGIALRDAQISRCQAGFAPFWSQPTLYNVLIYRVNTLVDSEDFVGDDLTAENVTAHYCTNLMADPLSTIRLTNCLFACVASPQCPAGPIMLTNNSVILSSDAAVFQTVGAGSHYLADQSPYRNAGTTNIDSTLLADLLKKTTYPPILYSNATFSAATTFSPQAQRDTDTPDLGYHYDPLDYMFGGVNANADLTFTPGTAVGWFRTSQGWYHAGHGIHAADNTTITFSGTLEQPDYWVRCNVVQEQPVYAGYGPGGITGWTYPSVTDAPKVIARFTRCSIMASEAGNHFRDDSGILQLHATDCTFLGGKMEGYDGLYYFTNCLFDRTSLWLMTSETFPTMVFRNCTLRGGSLGFLHWEEGAEHFCTSVRDTIFDGTSVATGYPGDPACVDYDYNAFLQGATRTNPQGANDRLVTSYNWQTSWLGNYYQPTDSPLIDAGSRTADVARLYHYTTQSNQVKETTSVVDIGYHYVAVDANGNPNDTDGDGIPDYIEDANGNGTVDSGETDWQDAADVGLKVLITEPKKNSNLP